MVDPGSANRHHGLTDAAWELLAPLIPSASSGQPQAEDRRVISGMVYKIRTGGSWRPSPKGAPSS
ncbi:transposase [Streptomyces sp. NPDC023588]|uniref:transposase n=1 Tax=Streptomyces sp. NPDC023588 TaxID=3154907 RepID=UPI0034047343